MKYTIADKEGYIRADLLERQDAEETEAFLKAIGVERREHQRKAVLICVHTTRAVFRVEKYHASRFLETLAALRDVSVALVSRHLESLASAIRWLTASSTQSAPPARKSSL